MNREALLQVRRVLEKVRDEERPFNMMFWSEKDKIPHSITVPVAECGTASCAAGWAARDPWFQERGLRLEKPYPDSDSLFPKLGRQIGFDAMALLLDISRRDAHYLFDPWDYPHWPECPRHDRITPDMVIERIDDLLAGYEPEEDF